MIDSGIEVKDSKVSIYHIELFIRLICKVSFIKPKYPLLNRLKKLLVMCLYYIGNILIYLFSATYFLVVSFLCK